MNLIRKSWLSAIVTRVCNSPTVSSTQIFFTKDKLYHADHCVVLRYGVTKRDRTNSNELRTTNELVETVDDFVAVQSPLVQQRSTSLNTWPVNSLKPKCLKIRHLRIGASTAF
jgi:hypothetical protein